MKEIILKIFINIHIESSSIVYKGKMCQPENAKDRNIKISYVINEKPNLNYVIQVKNEEINIQRINATQNTLVDRNNRIILKSV